MFPRAAASSISAASCPRGWKMSDPQRPASPLPVTAEPPAPPGGARVARLLERHRARHGRGGRDRPVLLPSAGGRCPAEDRARAAVRRRRQPGRDARQDPAAQPHRPARPRHRVHAQLREGGGARRRHRSRARRRRGADRRRPAGPAGADPEVPGTLARRLRRGLRRARRPRDRHAAQADHRRACSTAGSTASRTARFPPTPATSA